MQQVLALFTEPIQPSICQRPDAQGRKMMALVARHPATGRDAHDRNVDRCGYARLAVVRPTIRQPTGMRRNCASDTTTQGSSS
jgi:hypothetical protein